MIKYHSCDIYVYVFNLYYLFIKEIIFIFYSFFALTEKIVNDFQEHFSETV